MDWHNSPDPVMPLRKEAFTLITIETRELSKEDNILAPPNTYTDDGQATQNPPTLAAQRNQNMAIFGTSETQTNQMGSMESLILPGSCPTVSSSTQCSPVWSDQTMLHSEPSLDEYQQATLEQPMVDFDTSIWTDTLDPVMYQDTSISPEEILEATGAALLLPPLGEWQQNSGQYMPETPSIMPSPDPGISSSTTTYCCYEHGCNGRKFSSSSTYRRHCREQSACHKHTCAFCGQQFSRSSARDVHISQGRCKATHSWALS